MNYLITYHLNRYPPIFTNEYDFENHYMPGMTVYDLVQKKYSTDGLNWMDIDLDLDDVKTQSLAQDQNIDIKVKNPKFAKKVICKRNYSGSHCLDGIFTVGKEYDVIHNPFRKNSYYNGKKFGVIDDNGKIRHYLYENHFNVWEFLY